MFSAHIALLAMTAYVVVLFLIAFWVERRAAAKRTLADNSIVYALSLAVYCTAWTYYGSVGAAANSGLLFLTIYLGPTLSVFFWWALLRRMVRIRNTYRITSIADLISMRYGKSQSVAALITVIALVGITPYVALQLRAVISSFSLLTAVDSSAVDAAESSEIGPVVVVLMIVFTVTFGIRRLSPTGRHQGLVVAVAIESGVKLLAFLLVGFVVTRHYFGGFGPLLEAMDRSPLVRPVFLEGAGASFMTWASYLLLAAGAIVLLPRQFHVAVVENPSEGRVRTAMWMLPVYLLLINLFVLPIAMAGLLTGYPAAAADTFVLRLPLDAGYPLVSLFVFLGGFSAATAMIMVSTTTMSTMVTNHLLLPVIALFPRLAFLQRHLLQCRWIAAVLGILVGYGFALLVGDSLLLVNLGIMSFVAVAQFGPALIGGLFWERGSRTGALMGLGGGFVVWFYAILLPSFADAGWVPPAVTGSGIIDQLLDPESLLGFGAGNRIANGTLWSLVLNVSLYVLGSFLWPADGEERRQAREIVSGERASDGFGETSPVGQVIELEPKVSKLVDALAAIYTERPAERIVETCAERLGCAGAETVSVVDFAELCECVERHLAGSIGAAAAHVTMIEARLITDDEARALSRHYAETMANLRLPPSEVRRKIDYFREREALLTSQSAELEQKIQERDQEIQARIQTERALKQSEEKLRAIFNQTFQLMGIFDLEGRMLDANQTALDYMGEPKEAAVGKYFWETPWWAHDESLVDELRQAFIRARTGQTVQLTVHVPRADAPVQHLDISLKPMTDATGVVSGIIVEARDVTQRLELEERLRQSQKLQAIGTLASGIAHDFNNLLQGISGYTELAVGQEDLDASTREHLQEIQRLSKDGASLIRELLVFSRKVEPELRACDLREEVSKVYTLLERLLPAEIETRLELPVESLPVACDPVQIEQVLMNLASNARDAMPAGGELTISAKPVDLDRAFCEEHLGLEPGPHVRIDVRDTGIGMDEDVRSQIFEPFFTTKGVGEGTGLGLAMAYGIVEAHRGLLSCSSEPGLGTEFSIYLRRSMAEIASTASTAEAVELARGNGERILIADDEEVLRKIAVECLAACGYETETAATGEQVLSRLAKNPRVDLVLLDVGMPGMGGLRCAETILERDPRARIVMMSGYTAGDQIRRVLTSGVHSFLIKPYPLTELVRCVAAALRA